MNAIRIHTQIDSEILRLPEIRPLIGKNVEIIVLEELPQVDQGGIVRDRYNDFLALAGKNVVDPSALNELRSASVL